jgi:hypothetical protein
LLSRSGTTKRLKRLRPSGAALPSLALACGPLALSSSALLGEIGAVVFAGFALAFRQPLVQVRAARVQIMRAVVRLCRGAVRLFGALARSTGLLRGLDGVVRLLRHPVSVLPAGLTVAGQDIHSLLWTT